MRCGGSKPCWKKIIIWINKWRGGGEGSTPNIACQTLQKYADHLTLSLFPPLPASLSRSLAHSLIRFSSGFFIKRMWALRYSVDSNFIGKRIKGWNTVPCLIFPLHSIFLRVYRARLSKNLATKWSIYFALSASNKNLFFFYKRTGNNKGMFFFHSSRASYCSRDSSAVKRCFCCLCCLTSNLSDRAIWLRVVDVSCPKIRLKEWRALIGWARMQSDTDCRFDNVPVVKTYYSTLFTAVHNWFYACQLCC